MKQTVEVRIAGRGSVRDEVAAPNAAQVAHCDLCGQDCDAVASTTATGGAPFACKGCLRTRLEAMTLGAWLLKPADAGIPWGKVSG
jgi:hypothetical protein